VAILESEEEDDWAHRWNGCRNQHNWCTFSALPIDNWLRDRPLSISS
jgi:hypothetical protein